MSIEIIKRKAKPEPPKSNRFVWEDGDVEITPPKPGDPLPDPPKGPFDPIADKMERDK